MPLGFFSHDDLLSNRVIPANCTRAVQTDRQTDAGDRAAPSSAGLRVCGAVRRPRLALVPVHHLQRPAGHLHLRRLRPEAEGAGGGGGARDGPPTGLGRRQQGQRPQLRRLGTHGRLQTLAEQPGGRRLEAEEAAGRAAEQTVGLRRIGPAAPSRQAAGLADQAQAGRIAAEIAGVVADEMEDRQAGDVAEAESREAGVAAEAEARREAGLAAPASKSDGAGRLGD